tara:strand:+ start:155 stop:865 length:711 start_codon:yes stop_codon:yes gene_type:complete
MKDATVQYKDSTIHYYDLLESGYNPDTQIRKGIIYSREDHQFGSLLPHIPEGGVVYDIGAYIGTFSIPMSLEGFNVHAFEGFPFNAKRATKNCEAYPSITVHDVAVSNKSYSVTTKFNDCTDQGEREEAPIQYVKLDDYMKEHSLPNPDFVKLDIEGMETVALFGMENLIKNVKPVWQLCYHAGHPEKHDHYPGFVKTEDGGFDFKTLFEDYNISVAGNPVTEFNQWGEYLMVPKR